MLVEMESKHEGREVIRAMNTIFGMRDHYEMFLRRTNTLGWMRLRCCVVDLPDALVASHR